MADMSSLERALQLKCTLEWLSRVTSSRKAELVTVEAEKRRVESGLRQLIGALPEPDQAKFRRLSKERIAVEELVATDIDEMTSALHQAASAAPPQDRRDQDVHWLLGKVMVHVGTIAVLAQGRMSVGAPHRIHDFPSAGVLVRAAYEAYLTLNYIFVDPQADAEEKEFRRLSWGLATVEQEFALRTVQLGAGAITAAERSEADRIVADMESYLTFKRLTHKEQRALRRGLSRGMWLPPGIGWKHLAEIAGLSNLWREKMYPFWCAVAHCARGVAENAFDLFGQRAATLLHSTATFNAIVLAFTISDFMSLYPSSRNVLTAPQASTVAHYCEARQMVPSAPSTGSSPTV